MMGLGSVRLAMAGAAVFGAFGLWAAFTVQGHRLEVARAEVAAKTTQIEELHVDLYEAEFNLQHALIVFDDAIAWKDAQIDELGQRAALGAARDTDMDALRQDIAETPDDENPPVADVNASTYQWMYRRYVRLTAPRAGNTLSDQD